MKVYSGACRCGQVQQAKRELWVKRREPWLRPVDGAEQYEEDRSS